MGTRIQLKYVKQDGGFVSEVSKVGEKNIKKRNTLRPIY